MPSNRLHRTFSKHEIAHKASSTRRLVLDVPELSESMVRSISQLETAGQVDHIAIRLHRITSALKLLCSLKLLRSLDVSHTTISNEDLKDLQGCRNLVKLDLSFCRRVTDLFLISHFKTLEVVKLSGCHQLIGALGSLPRLKELDLSEAAVTDEDVRLLSECRTLVKINLSSCKALTNVDPLSSIATLEEIDLSGCTSLNPVGALGEFPVLKVVDLSSTPITDEDVRLLSESYTLVEINLRSCEALKNVNSLSSIATLEEIDLSGCASLTHVGALGKLPVLKEVDLSSTPITDEEVRQLSESHTLVKINLIECKSLTTVNPLSSIASLEVINLSGCSSLTRVGELGKLPALKEVNLSGTPILDEEIRLLGECHTLVKIDLHYCKALTNVKPLSSIATLELIDLSRCSALTHVGELGRFPVLKEVNLSGTPILDEEIRLLGECHTLVKIDLQSCKALTNVKPLSSIETLEVINLSYCTSLTHVGALRRFPVLKEVVLGGTPITDGGVRLLGESHTLVKIDLQSCKALTNVNPLSSIETLEVINLLRCSALTYVGALGRLPALKEVNLSETHVTDGEIRLLSESHSLVKIDLQSCKALTNVEPLASITTLEEIDLSYCTSLTHLGTLGKLPVLKVVFLSRTRITDEEVNSLKSLRENLGLQYTIIVK